MSYKRRDTPNIDEQIPLPIEIVYNSYSDALITIDKQTGHKSYYGNDNKHFNRIYFNYPPEWKTSILGEKIIGIRNMKISIRKFDIWPSRQAVENRLRTTFVTNTELLINLDNVHSTVKKYREENSV